jgi:hypothetical protein
MSNFYQEAILDAKAVRASALANAKATLIEEFEPQVSTLVSKQLAEKVEEELDETNMHSSEEEMEEGQLQQEETELDEASLDEILAELESLAGAKKDMTPSYEEEGMHETKDHEEIGGHKKSGLKTAEKETAYKIKAKDSIKEDAEEEMDEAKDHEEIAGHKGMKNKSDDDAYKMKAKNHIHEDGEEEGEEGGEGAEESGEATDDDTKVIDITLGDLKQVLQSVMAGQGTSDHTTGDDDTEIAGGEVSLDEILDELSQMEETKDNEPVAKGGVKGKKQFGVTYNKLSPKVGTGDYIEDLKEDEEEIEEAKKTIEELRSTLQEVNLLNAKLLYVNKLFRAGKLTETQKMNVVKNLDKAETAKEAEKIYSTLKESFSVKTRSTIKESMGFASQAAGIAPKTNIIEAEPYVTRWQTLAGIKK